MNDNRNASWIIRREGVVFLLFVILHLFPIWIFTYIPTQDGPSHIYNAIVIKEYPSQSQPIFQKYYTLNKNQLSNWAGHLILSGLTNVFPNIISEKILSSIYVIMLPVLARYAFRSMKPEASVLSFLIFPFIYNFNFHMGFYSFSYTLPLFFLLVGYWINHSEILKFRDYVFIGLLSVIIILFHIMTFFITSIFILTFQLYQFFIEYKNLPSNRPFLSRDTLRIFLSRVFLPSLSLLPALVIAFHFFMSQGVASSGMKLDFNFSLAYLSSFGRNEDFVYVLFQGFLLILFVILNKWDLFNIISLNVYYILLAVYALLFFIAPHSISAGSIISPRLVIFLYFSLILCLGSFELTVNIRKAILFTSIFISSMLLILHSVKYREINIYIDEYVSAGYFIKPGTVVLPICFSPEGQSRDHTSLSTKVLPFLHASGYVAAEHGNIDLSNYEARGNLFPTKFKENLDPYIFIGPIELLNGQIDFLTYPQRTGGKIDYVMLWGQENPNIPPVVIQSIYRQLGKGYDLIYESQYKNMRLYKNKSSY